MTAEVMTLGRLLDGRFRFRLTCFQRAYAWRTEHVVRLLSDLFHAMQQRGNKRRYALGRLMLSQQPGAADTELVDGHQRLLTLTMLFAVLRDLETDAVRADALHRLISDDNWGDKDPRRYRIIIQSLPAPLFDRLVQQRGATDNEPEIPRESLSESERNILENRECIRSELLAPGTTDQFRRDLADFLLQSCYVLAVVVDNQEDAWDMLARENDTRLLFSHADEAKSVILSGMRREDHIPAARLWESCESFLNPEDIYRLLSHIRAIHWRGRVQSSRPVESEIAERISLSVDGLRFMSEQFVPYANRLRDLRHKLVGRPGIERESVAQHIEYLSWVDPHAWVPAALQWMKVAGTEGPDTVEFFRRLDRLVWLSKIAGVDPGVQETRILNLIAQIEANTGLAGLTKLDVDAKLQADALGNLRSINFGAKHWAGYLLRRLSILHGTDPGPILRDEVTLEHVLPKNPPSNSEWRRIFGSPEACKAHCQRIGNMVLLSGRENNHESGTRPWREKREIFAQSAFVLARDAASESEWTAKTIDRRTNRLIETLFAHWGLEPTQKTAS